MPLFKRNETWWIDLCHRGRRVRRSTETSDRAVAQRQHDELKAKLWKEKQGGRRLADALLAWLDEKPRSRKDESYVARLSKLYPDRPLIDVSPGSFETEMPKALSPGNYNRYLVILRASLNIAKRLEWIESVPAFKRKPEPLADDAFLSPEEWQRLRAELPEHLQDMADFAIATGLRWSNVALMEWERVSIPNKLCWIPGPAAKGRKPIAVPLSDAALEVLERVSEVDPVFVFTYNGTPIGSPKTAFNKAKVRAGLPRITWHRLRHTWASWHAQAGTPMEVLQQLGGWASKDMLDRYAHLSPSYLAQYANNAALPQVLPQGKRR